MCIRDRLGDQAGIRGLGAACAGARELKQRLVELRTLDGNLGNNTGDVVLLADVLDAVVESSLLSGLALLRLHLDGLGGADGDALAAAPVSYTHLSTRGGRSNLPAGH